MTLETNTTINIKTNFSLKPNEELLAYTKRVEGAKHYQRVEEGIEAAKAVAYNPTEQLRIAEELKTDAFRQMSTGKKIKYFKPEFVTECIRLVLDGMRYKKAIKKVAEIWGYTQGQLEDALKYPAQNKQKKRKPILDKFSGEIRSLVRYGHLDCRASLGGVRSPKLPQLLSTLEHAVRRKNEKEKEKVMAVEAQKEAKLAERFGRLIDTDVSEFGKQEKRTLVLKMKDCGYTHDQIAKTADISKRTVIRWSSK